MTELENAVALVTGAASGIGRATAVAFARAGADVVVADINAAGAVAVAAEIEGLGRRALALRTDVGRREDVEDMVAQAISWQGRCDVFISNAGIGCTGAAHEFTVEQWHRILDIDLHASIWATRLLVPHMLERGTGHLAFVSSGAGFIGIADRAPYCVAKFGLIGLAESLARQLKETGVRVSIIVPGAVKTPVWSSYVVARASEMSSEEIEEQRAARQNEASGWPSPEVMAEKILDGIRDDRVYILQENPHEPEWFGNLHKEKGRDPDAFVLGSRW